VTTDPILGPVQKSKRAASERTVNVASRHKEGVGALPRRDPVHDAGSRRRGNSLLLPDESCRRSRQTGGVMQARGIRAQACAWRTTSVQIVFNSHVALDRACRRRT
jgi:hypothetical protein